MATRSKPEIVSLEQSETLPMQMPTPQQVFNDADDPVDIALSNVLADLGGESDAKVNVYLVEPGKGNSFVGTFDPVSFSIEAIQQTYGAGEYKIHVRQDGRLVANRTVRIAATKSNVTALPMQNNNAEISKLAEAMNAGFQQMGNMLAQTVQAIAGNQPKAKTTQEMLQEMMLMKQLLEPASQPQPANQMDMFMKGLEFAKDITPREGDPGAGEIILEAIKNFGGMLNQAKTGAAPVSHMAMPMQPSFPPMVQPVTMPSPQAVQSPIPEIQPATEDNMSLVKKMYLATLLSNAKADNDPMTYASMAVDLQGEAAAAEFANNPRWFELLCAELPEAKDFRPWFDEMRENVLLIVSQTNSDTGILTDSQESDKQGVIESSAIDHANQPPSEPA